jgi:hypothetical protein
LHNVIIGDIVSFLVTVIVIELATIPDFRPSRAMFGQNGHRMIDFSIKKGSYENDSSSSEPAVSILVYSNYELWLLSPILDVWASFSAGDVPSFAGCNKWPIANERPAAAGERQGMMCDVLIFGACTPGYDSDP